MTKIIDDQNAKQGRWGGRVLMVLTASITLALIAWAIAEVYGQMVQP